ncbi:hypothetical protein LQR31_03575 [Chromobacterium vaccinii]|uniref:hypothetical protein n=1 Tax=Chromobacterium vaccinii TaxID=1108595 RepID=UPI001E47F8AD|nr:hypothetical protein [Chromobacterium vaccinii]MCD4483553.1 hypothetical protein [Chromobacterium vaccinii]MCD4498492.1 hypothetical protein [Chromobacterium vaccinii]
MKGCIRLSGALLAAALAVAAVAPAEAYYHHGGPHISINVWRGGYWNHGYYHGRMGWWWVVGGAWYFYTAPIYPYPSLYAPPAVAVAPAVPVVPAVPMAPPAPPVAAAPQESAQVWYYCKAAKQYYPYVSECPGGWKTVPAQPPR